MIAVPDTFTQTTLEREGEPGAAWLAELPGIVDELLECWGCVPDGDVTHGGVGVIVPVRRRTEGTAVLKVSFPHPGNVHEPDAFAVWGGRGAVLLHERDDENVAMLLERVRMSTLAEVEDNDEVVTVAARISRRLAVPAPPGLPRLRERADAWEEQLRRDAQELAHTLSRHVVEAAAATVRELGGIQPDVLIHGDLHARNILRADREPWLAVDPKGYAGDPAYDGGTLLTSRALTLLAADDLGKAAHRTLDIFAEAAELDRERVRRWAQLHAVQAAFR
ncbi:aminoglycoside phosphotransferase family protein, partial [Streptomyces sp. NPDC056730]